MIRTKLGLSLLKVEEIIFHNLFLFNMCKDFNQKLKYVIEKWLNLFEERGERKVFLTASVKIKV